MLLQSSASLHSSTGFSHLRQFFTFVPCHHLQTLHLQSPMYFALLWKNLMPGPSSCSSCVKAGSFLRTPHLPPPKRCFWHLMRIRAFDHPHFAHVQSPTAGTWLFLGLLGSDGGRAAAEAALFLSRCEFVGGQAGALCGGFGSA